MATVQELEKKIEELEKQIEEQRRISDSNIEEILTLKKKLEKSEDDNKALKECINR